MSIVDAALDAVNEAERGEDESLRLAAGAMREEFEHRTRTVPGVDEATRQAWVGLRRRALDAQRQRLDHLRSLGVYDSDELEVAQRMIDQEEVRWADLER